MYAAFFVAFVFESNFIMFSEIYLLFGQSFGEVTVWLVILFTVLTSSAFELALQFNYKFKKQDEDYHE